MASIDNEPSTSKTPSIRFRMHTSLSSQIQAGNQVTTKAPPDNEEPFLTTTSITNMTLSTTTSSSHRHSASSSTTSSISSTNRMHLLSYSEIPDWMKDNDCLKKG